MVGLGLLKDDSSREQNKKESEEGKKKKKVMRCGSSNLFRDQVGMI